jgi:ribosomal protein S18 acetylase RimI-like enzyme
VAASSLDTHNQVVAAELDGSRTAALQGVAVREAHSMEDYKRVARVHRLAFYPAARDFFAAFLEWDRAAGLEFRARSKHGKGHYACLLAERGDGEVVATVRKRTSPLRKCCDSRAHTHTHTYAHVQAALEASAESFERSTLVKLRRQATAVEPVARGLSIGYVSNLSVSPGHRRQGLGRRLVDEAERKASDWGCAHVLLHCDAADTAAVQLYRSAGYRTVSLEPVWMAPLMLRSARLMLMMKRLTKTDIRG